MSSVTINVEDLFGASFECSAIITPTASWIDGSKLLITRPRTIFIPRSGSITLIGVRPGYYSVQFASKDSSLGSAYTIGVPNDSFDYLFTELITAGASVVIPPSILSPSNGEQLRWTDRENGQVYVLRIVDAIPTFVLNSTGSFSNGENLRWTDTVTGLVHAYTLGDNIPEFGRASLGNATAGESVSFTDTITGIIYHYFLIDGIPTPQPA